MLSTSVSLLLLALSSGSHGAVPLGPETAPLLVRLEQDPAQQAAFLEELAGLRSGPERSAIAQRFAQRAEGLRGASSELEARILAAGGQILARQVLDPGLVVRGLPQDFLRGLPGVREVEANHYHRCASLQVALNVQHHDTQGANLLLDSQNQPIEGTGVVIGLIDTGIDAQMGSLNRPHRAFYRDANPNLSVPGGIAGSRILSAVHEDQFCFSACADPEDLHGHGTRMASIAMGFRYNFNPGVANGAAPDALLRSYRVDNDNLSGIASFLSMNQALDRAVADGVDVILMPWDGTLHPTFGSNPSIDAAVLAGVPVVLSGSNADNPAVFHGCYNGIVVGASDLQSFEPFTDGSFFVSPSGPLNDGRRYPELLAVGEKLTSAVPDNEQASVDSYGTSGAAAITAGTIALMLQANPSLTPRQIRALLLDSSAEIVLGDPQARGLGYLRAKRAVQQAQVGLATEGSISGLVSYRWDVPLTAGQNFRSALAWEQTGLFPGNDLDLTLRDPSGAIVAAGQGNFAPMELLRYKASSAGIYTLTLEHISSASAGQGVAFAITGLPGTAATVLANPCAGQLPVTFTFQQGGEWVSPVAPEYTLVKGCGLDKVSAVRIGTTPISFNSLSTKALLLNLPGDLPWGFSVVTLDFVGGGILQGILSIGDDAVLSAPYNLGTSDAGSVVLNYKPQAPFVILGSLSLQPTSLPGFVELALGAGGQQLFSLATGTLSAAGSFAQALPPLPGTPALIGSSVHLQAALIDPVLPAIPLETSNVTSTLLIF